jgi:hypothetical protein
MAEEIVKELDKKARPPKIYLSAKGEYYILANGKKVKLSTIFKGKKIKTLTKKELVALVIKYFRRRDTKKAVKKKRRKRHVRNAHLRRRVVSSAALPYHGIIYPNAQQAAATQPTTITVPGPAGTTINIQGPPPAIAAPAAPPGLPAPPHVPGLPAAPHVPGLPAAPHVPGLPAAPHVPPAPPAPPPPPPPHAPRPDEATVTYADGRKRIFSVAQIAKILADASATPELRAEAEAQRAAREAAEAAHEAARLKAEKAAEAADTRDKLMREMLEKKHERELRSAFADNVSWNTKTRLEAAKLLGHKGSASGATGYDKKGIFNKLAARFPVQFKEWAETNFGSVEDKLPKSVAQAKRDDLMAKIREWTAAEAPAPETTVEKPEEEPTILEVPKATEPEAPTTTTTSTLDKLPPLKPMIPEKDFDLTDEDLVKLAADVPPVKPSLPTTSFLTDEEWENIGPETPVIRPPPEEGSGAVEGGLWDTQIDAIMRPYVPDGYLGTIAADDVAHLRLPKYPEGDPVRYSFIMNLSNSDEPGTHWVAVFFDDLDKSLEYFDSFGRDPNDEFLHNIVHFVRQLRIDYLPKFKINRIVEQRKDTVTCGYFAMKLLMDRYAGIPFKECTGYKAHKTVNQYEAGIKRFAKKFSYIVDINAPEEAANVHARK